MDEITKELKELEFDEPLEEEIGYIDVHSTKRKVYTDQGDPEIESLYGKYKRGKLIIQPDFQRHFVWDATKSSRLIESALLDIPIPVIYLSEENGGREYVIDGQQRLTAFFSFVDGHFPDGKDFKLSNLKVFREFNRKSFKDLDDELQDKIRYLSLNNQELRNCVFRGPYNELLKELSTDKDFMYLLGLERPDKRMKDIELVLRFAAFYHSTYLNYKPPMRKFLNDEMGQYQHISNEESLELKNAFKNTVTIIKSLLDTHAFKRFYKGSEKNPNGSWELKKFNASLYDILMFSFAREDKSRVYQNLDSIREAFICLMTSDQEFIDSIDRGTSEVQAVTTRFDKWRLTLQDIIGIAQKEPRCFSLKLKQELYDNEQTCSICGQNIQNIDDAAMDHIEQYWAGGKTIPENARLTHRYCNGARPRWD
jgi:hypothetical protein